MNSTVHDIGALEDFETGMPRRISVEGKALVVVRKGDSLFALRDSCPHEGARLSDGRVIGMACAARPGEAIGYDRVGEILSCPWHGWEFDVTTGKSLTRPDRIKLKTYPVHVENDRVLIDL